MNIDELHKQVLEKIASQGAIAGIDFYFENSQRYESLNSPKVQFLWCEILEAIKEKTGFGDLSILCKDDPFLDDDLSGLTSWQIDLIREYRQKIPIKKDYIYHCFGVYQAMEKLRQERDPRRN